MILLKPHNSKDLHESLRLPLHAYPFNRFQTSCAFHYTVYLFHLEGEAHHSLFQLSRDRVEDAAQRVRAT